MASGSKFELSSGSPDGLMYPSGQRGSYVAASLDRSGRFREGMENRVSVFPGMPRSGSSLSHGDVINLLQSLPFDTKAVAAEQNKPPRQGEVKRVIAGALGISMDDSSPVTLSGKALPSSSQDELRRVRANLFDCSIRARDRAKTLSDAIAKLDKSIGVTRKRSRSDVSPSDRSNVMMPGDRSAPGGSINKMGSQSHILNSNAYEPGSQKPEDRTKNAVPNKRVRTSMVEMDVRATGLTRPSGPMDRDRDTLRLGNGTAIQSEEKGRALTAGVDGWEKSKMRKKRSGIKSDVYASTVFARTLEGDREPKRGMQQRLGIESRSRLSDSHGFRSGSANGAVGVGKLDMTSQQNGLGMRSTTRIDQDSGTLPNDRRDRPVGSEKERFTLKAVNKPNIREDNCAASPTSITKMNATARAPRSISGALPKSSPNARRSIGTPDDLEHSNCTSKLHAVPGDNNRKRSTSARSSSSPVTQWVGQRSQKIRVGRRTNFNPLGSSHDEAPASDTIGNVGGADNVLGFPRRMSSNAPQVKLKGDHMLTAGLSESEESGAVDNKSKDKSKRSGEVDEKAGPTAQKVATMGLSSRKNKVATDEDVGDGVRRQGRTGRGFGPTRSSMSPTMEKVDNAATVKQLRSVRLGSDKIESKAGRPPTKKLPERKAYTRPRHAINGAPEFAGESDNDHEELMAAANAALNTSNACSSSFWRQTEPVFGFVSAEDMVFLKEQVLDVKMFHYVIRTLFRSVCSLVELIFPFDIILSPKDDTSSIFLDESAANMSLPSNTDPNSKGDLGYSSLPSTPSLVSKDEGGTVLNGILVNECERDIELLSETKHVPPLAELLMPGIEVQSGTPLSLRVIAAAIQVDDIEELYCFSPADEHFMNDAHAVRLDLDARSKSQSLNQKPFDNFPIVGRATSNGYRVTASRSYLDELELDELESDHGMLDPSTETASTFAHALNGLRPKQSVISSMVCTEFQYEQMCLDDRILLELQSIGIFPENLGEDDEISEDIMGLEEKLHRQVTEKKNILLKLEKAATEAREVQEREIERIALDKLVRMAYDKYMAFRGSSGGKSTANRITKHAVLAFVKRVLARCQKFEDTGKSCFSEPTFKDLFHSLSSHNTDTEHTDNNVEATLDSDNSSMIPRHEQKTDTHDKDSDAFRSLNHLTEQAFVKEETWSNRVKRRELLLDDVGNATGTSLRTPPGIASSLVSGGTKGKRSERDREGKGHNREVLSRNSTPKGRPASCNIKGERKSKAKPKQKTTQLSASVTGLLGKASELPKGALSSVSKSSDVVIDGNNKEKDESGSLSINDTSNDPEAIDLSHLQLPGIDLLGVPDDMDGQGQDIASWLNIDDEGFQETDFMGLHIPMDDLSDLNMNFQS